jgi:hypothetical protein
VYGASHCSFPGPESLVEQKWLGHRNMIYPRYLGRQQGSEAPVEHLCDGSEAPVDRLRDGSGDFVFMRPEHTTQSYIITLLIYFYFKEYQHK